MATLAPGFRFRPTDAELIGYYLAKKVGGHPLEFDVIADVDIYKCEPWDLPGKSRIPSQDLEWFFFCPRDKKYRNSSRTNRATEKGYWKATGRDRNVTLKGKVAGMKKTLVYHTGRAPKGERTDWIMHEYRLEGELCDGVNRSHDQDGQVLCRMFKKSALDHTIESSKSAEIAPAPKQEVDHWASTEGDGKPHVEVSPVQALTEELPSESQGVEDDDGSEEVRTAPDSDEELPKDANTGPPVAAASASSPFDLENIVSLDCSSALECAEMQRAVSNLFSTDDGGIGIPVITNLRDMDLPDLWDIDLPNLWDTDLPDLVSDSPVTDRPIFCPDHGSPSVETEYNGDPFHTIFGSGEVERDISSLGIVHRTHSGVALPMPTSRKGRAKRRSPTNLSIRLLLHRCPGILKKVRSVCRQ